MKIRTLVLCFFLLALQTLQAFEVKEVQTGTAARFLKWNAAKGPIRVFLNKAGSSDIPIAAAESSLKAAMNQWQGVPGQSVRFEYAGTSPAAVANSNDNINSVLWVEKKWAYSSTVMAITRYSFFLTDPPELADADILINGQNFQWSTDPSSSTQPQRVLTHELGHLLGLSHTAVASAVMFPFYGAGKPTPLSPDERAGIQFLYGAPIQDFRPITPLTGALYSEKMSERGLPLPVFRWGGNTLNQYEIEFSGAPSFQKKLKFTAGNKTSFALTGSQELQLENMNPQGSVFWRVTTGTQKTPSRVLRFKSATQAGQSATLQPEETGLSLRILAVIFAVAVPLITGILLLIRRKKSVRQA